MKFCNFNGEILSCDDATIEKYGLQVLKEVSDEEFIKNDCQYHIEAGKIVLGKSLQEQREERILELKRFLSDTDHKAIKYAEGEFTAEEYAPIKQQRKEWREEINELEELLQK